MLRLVSLPRLERLVDYGRISALEPNDEDQADRAYGEDRRCNELD